MKFILDGDCRRARINAISLTIIVLVAIIVASRFMNQRMRFDEAFTFNHYILLPGELTHYSMVNNHLLHTALVKLSTLTFGNSEISIRLPAFVFGMLSVVLVWLLARCLVDDHEKRWAGWLAAMGIAVHPFLVLFATNARGYTMIVFFTLLLMFALLKHLNAASPESGLHWLCISGLVSVLGLWTNPTMLYPIAGLAFWLAIESFPWPSMDGLRIEYLQAFKKLFLTMVIYCFIVAVGSTLVYSPSLMRAGGIQDLFDRKLTQSLAEDAFYGGLLQHVFHAYGHLLRDVSGELRCVWGFFFLAGITRLSQRSPLPQVSLVPSFFVGTGALFFIKQSLPFDRNWIFLIPLSLVIADVGMASLLTKLNEKVAFGLLAWIACSLTWYGAGLMQTNRISTYNDTGTFREVIEVRDFLAAQLTPGDVVVTRVPLSEPLKYYLYRAGVNHVSFANVVPNIVLAGQEELADAIQPKVYAVVREVDTRNPRTEGLTECFRAGQAVVWRGTLEPYSGKSGRMALNEFPCISIAARQP